MQEELQQTPTKEIPPVGPGVCFDPEEAILEGTYLDELSAYRAKKVWTTTLETNFLLESNFDFIFQVNSNIDTKRFVVKCDFTSACGRYAFWRLTRNQAPEAQYLIETAHIPQTESHNEEFLSAPDLEPISSSLSKFDVSQRDLSFGTKLRKLVRGYLKRT